MQVVLDSLIQTLVDSKNEAADELLLEAVRLGNQQEQEVAIQALLRRQSSRGLSGLVGMFDWLAEPLQTHILDHVRLFHQALGECGRSSDQQVRLAAMKLIALGRQGKLAYVLSENLHNPDPQISKAAVDALVALSRWISIETRRLNSSDDWSDEEQLGVYQALMENRPEIEAAVARAMDLHRGRHGQELLRAALLLCDWPGSKTLAILHTSKHGGQALMVRRLQQPPASEHVEAFLLGATHGGLRSHFGIIFSHIDEAPVLDALLRKTHWLKDHQLQLCMHQVVRGTWWDERELARDLERRTPQDAARIGQWLAVSGMHDVMQDQRMEKLLERAGDDFAARLQLLRIAMQRKRGSSVQLLRSLLKDPDERIMRMAAREIVRRRPVDYENMLLQTMTSAPESVRRVVSRAIGKEGFEQYWQRFARMDRQTRQQAGKAMLKLLPDATQRLWRRLATGAVDQRMTALQIVQELGLAHLMHQTILSLCSHPDARLRSKAVKVLADVTEVNPDVILEKALNDVDPRVRANAIEVLEAKRSTEYVPLLMQRARSASNRERANAIRAMHRLRLSTASTQLLAMLRDHRSEHRISALWALRQIGWWQLLNEVGRIARQDENLRVRRYALAVLRGVADMVGSAGSKAG